LMSLRSCFYFFLLLLRRPLRSTLFPYTTLFRSVCRCLFALTPHPSSLTQEVLVLPHWTMGRLVGENENEMSMNEKGRYANCLLRSEEHTSELQSLAYLVCRLLLEKKKHPFTDIM